MRHSWTAGVLSLYCVAIGVGIGILATCGVAAAGPFPNPSVGPGSIVFWADGVFSFVPAIDGSPGGDVGNALGPADGSFYSLGDLTDPLPPLPVPGSITLTFSQPIYDGAGGDLAVFENVFNFFPPDDEFVFAELGFVEVSSNGVDFARFPSISLSTEGAGDPATDIITPFGRDFAGVLPSNTNNLAGIHGQGIGTLFDLSDLAADPLVVGGLVNLGSISFVRVVDIPGDGTFLDSLGNPILDAFSTISGFANAGLDLDAVGALHVVPEPGTAALLGAGLAAFALRRWRARAAR